MERHAFAQDYELTPQQLDQFRTLGFVKLPGFLNDEVLDSLRKRVDVELRHVPSAFETEFKRLKYDFETSREDLYALLTQPYFRRTMTELTGRTMFLTFEMCFELEKNVSKGFPWHVGVQSFGYVRADDFACTIWAPLHPIDPAGQRGGMQYVPRTVMSAEFVYEYVEPALVQSLRIRAERGEPITLEDYFALREGVLNSPAMLDILEPQAVEDAFEPGDVLLFDKYVVHRSRKLGEGPLDRRDAFVMRFVDVGARYDRQRALNIDFPVRQFGYQPYTRSHLEVATVDGELLADSPFFDNRGARTISYAEVGSR
ncbi:hypothetical protein SAMN05421835_11517 [Amycolatopsis sacchari]|uniref:Phytanoyl-CoA dioxygenase (PhyH) n=1 Tax=Amycolatopsis sacchari TaxID=115433 RepID=A0A1I3XCH3_9PSEU|nr:hypothetical protein [Amycolatopsis sacchari]SFK17174.1 hypothetical protein SAMN05421835_11517 [Amycolatopsis sacchari]